MKFSNHKMLLQKYELLIICLKTCKREILHLTKSFLSSHILKTQCVGITKMFLDYSTEVVETCDIITCQLTCLLTVTNSLAPDAPLV